MYCVARVRQVESPSTLTARTHQRGSGRNMYEWTPERRRVHVTARKTVVYWASARTASGDEKSLMRRARSERGASVCGGRRGGQKRGPLQQYYQVPTRR
jgi:hypothetical protein